MGRRGPGWGKLTGDWALDTEERMPIALEVGWNLRQRLYIKCEIPSDVAHGAIFTILGKV